MKSDMNRESTTIEEETPAPVIGMKRPSGSHPVLIYDGVCGFCNSSVQMVLRHDPNGTLRFAPLQGDYAKAIIARHPELGDIDSVIYVEPTSATGSERVYVRSTAALKVTSYLGGFWKLLNIAYVIPSPIRNFFYDLFAKYRYRLFGKYDACLIPAPEVRKRFL